MVSCREIAISVLEALKAELKYKQCYSPGIGEFRGMDAAIETVDDAIKRYKEKESEVETNE